MIVLTFQPQFAELVRTGAKRQTIRLERKRPIKPGDVLSLRAWTGKPYVSKQVELGPRQECKSVERFMMQNCPFEDLDPLLLFHVGDATLNIIEMGWLARSDGFEDLYEMYTWFCKTHGLPFRGVLIKW